MKTRNGKRKYGERGREGRLIKVKRRKHLFILCFLTLNPCVDGWDGWCCHGNSQCGQLSHVAEGEGGQYADAVVAQVPVQIQGFSAHTRTNAQTDAKCPLADVCIQGYPRGSYTNDSCLRPASSLGTDASILPSRYLQGKQQSSCSIY